MCKFGRGVQTCRYSENVCSFNVHHAFKKGRKKTSKKMSVTKTLLRSSLPRICILSAILQSLVGWRTQEGSTGHSFNVYVKTSRSRENPVCIQENCTHTHTHPRVQATAQRYVLHLIVYHRCPIQVIIYRCTIRLK